MKDRLKEYVEKDEIYQDYKKAKLMNATDFDKFCIQHCKDIEELLEENEELRKELEENKNPLKGILAQVNDDMLLRNCGAMQSEIDDYKTQQQEFINWLENGIKKVKNTEFLDERIQRAGLVAYNRVLQKYKSIIGNDINVAAKGV